MHAPFRFVDIGINLAHESYDSDRELVIARAAAAGVTRMIVTGASVPGTRRALELARERPGVLWATAGCHPHHAGQCDAAALREFELAASDAAVVAIGECGLDYFRDLAPRAAQRAAFEAQLELAARCGKPVFLHQRDAHEDFLACLRPWRDRIVDGVAHCFTAGRDELFAYLDLGLHVGITGWICDERRGSHLAELVAAIPQDRLMLETDGPYLLPRDLRPMPAHRRNEPAYLPHIAARVAAARGEALADLAAHTTRTAERFFRLNQHETASVFV